MIQSAFALIPIFTLSDYSFLSGRFYYVFRDLIPIFVSAL